MEINRGASKHSLEQERPLKRSYSWSATEGSRPTCDRRLRQSTQSRLPLQWSKANFRFLTKRGDNTQKMFWSDCRRSLLQRGWTCCLAASDISR